MTVPHVLSAQSVLNFPRIISNGSLFTGLAVSNPTAADVSVTFTAFLPDGTPFTAPDIQNPITMKIPAGGQAAKLSTEIFGARDFNGWVQATSSSSGLTGFFLNGNTALTDLDGASSVSPSPEFILPFASEDSISKTEVTIVNVNTDPSTATLTLYGDDGGSLGSKAVALSARGFIRQTLSVLFPGTNLSAVTHLRVQANRPLVGHEVVADYSLAGSAVRRETAAISGQQATAATSYVLPEFATGGGWISLLGIVNAGGVGQQVTITAYKEDGTPWNIPGNPKLISLDGNAALRGTVGDLFGFPAGTLATGWLQVSSTLGYVSSYIAYGNTATPSFAVVTGTDASAGSKLDVFSQVAEGIGFFTGLTLVNPGAQDATLQFYTLRPDGTTVGTATLTVKAKQRIGELFTEILPSSLLQVGGWALIRSSQPLVAAVLFGSTNGYALANVPQQIPAGDFTPPAQLTGAINGSVRSNGTGIANIQVTLTGPVTATTTTDDQGRYIFSQLPAGDYKVTPVRVGAQFAPAVRSVTINKQNIDGADFDGGGLTSSNAPSLQFISPAATFAGNTALNVRILGTNFTPASAVQFNGQAAPTTFVSSVELQAVLSSDQLKAAGALLVTVVTPPPGGGISASITFTINPVPSSPLIRGRASVGSFPAGVAIDTTHNTALITNQSSDSVTVLDLKTLQVTSSILVGRSPAEGIAVHAGKNIALVANPGSNNVSVIDLQTNREVRKISVGNFPVGVAINSVTNRALVTNADDGTVSVIDLDSFGVSGQISVGTRPEGIAIEPNSNRAVVTNTGSNDAWILDLNTNGILAKIAVGQFPRGVAISSSANVAVVANANSNDISVIDLAGRTLLYSVKVDTGPTGVAIHELTNSALITNSGVARGSSDFSSQTTVSVLDIARRAISTTIQVGSAAFGIGVNQDAQEAVVADFGSNDVTIIRVPNPVPQVTDVNPKTFPAGGSGFTVTVTGSGFIPTSVVTLNGQALPTTYVSATELHADISSSIVQQLLQVQVQASGIKAGAAVAAATTPSFDISVKNPGPGGGGAPPPANPAANHLTPQNGLPVFTSISPTDTTAGAGAIVLTVSGNNFNSTSTLNFNGAMLSPTSTNGTSMLVTVPANLLLPGTYPVSVTNPAPGGGTTGSLPFTVNGAANPPPGVTSVTPSSLAAGSGATAVTVVGTGFIPGTTSSLGTAKGAVSGNTIIFSLSAADLQNFGTLNGLISNPAPGGGSATFSVSILNPAPTVTKFSPTSVTAGSSDLGISVSGTNFLGSSTITIEGTPIPTQFVSPTQLSGTVPASFLRRSGNVHVGVQNKAPGGGSADGGLLSITSALPTLTGLNPSQTPLLATPVDVTIQLTGTGFAGNSVAKGNGTSLTTVFNSATSLSATLPAALLGQGGPIDIVVVNPAPGGGTSGSVPFNVNNPVPSLTGVSPNQLRGDQTNVVLTVTGQNFVKTSTVALGTISLTTTFVSRTQLTAVTPSPMPFGKVTVTVSNPGPGGGKSNGIDIDITSLTPTITSVTPTAGAGQTIDVIGTNFGQGSVILLRGQAIPTTVVSTTALTGTIPANAASGTADIVVQNPATSSSPAQNSAPASLTIAYPAPAIVSLSPNPAPGNSAPQTIAVTGSGFVSSSVVQVNGTSAATSYIDPQTLSFTLPAITSAASIQVVNPGPGGGPSNTVTLNVTLPPPAISALTPSLGIVNTNIALTVSGSSFVPGASINFAGTLLATTFVNSGTLTASVTLGGTAGPVAVTVINPDGKTSAAATFQITPPSLPPPPATPAVTAINPTSLAAGSTMTVTLTGANFVVGATTVSVSGAGMMVGSVNATSSTSLTAFLIASGVPGPHNVTVTTSGGTSSPATLTVNASAFTGVNYTDVTHLAGNSGGSGLLDGVGSAARFANPSGIWSDGSNLYVADRFNHVIRKVAIGTGQVSTFAGYPFVPGYQDGPAGSALFRGPRALWGDGTNLYVADTGNQMIRVISLNTGAVTSLAGRANSAGSQNGAGGAAFFNTPTGIWGDGAGNLYIADSINNEIRKIVIATASVTTFAGSPQFGSNDGVGQAARFRQPTQVWGDGVSLFVADQQNDTIRQINLASASVSTLAGVAGNAISVDGAGSAARFNMPFAITGDASGNLYVADYGNPCNSCNADLFDTVIRKVVVATGTVTTIAGNPALTGSADGIGSAALFGGIEGLWTDGTTLFAADTLNNTIRAIQLSNASVSTVAGLAARFGSSDGTGAAAQFSGLALSWGDGVNLYVPDFPNHTIRKIALATGAVTTIAGTAGLSGIADGVGPSAQFNNPLGVWGDGRYLYITDFANNLVRTLDLSTNAVTTLAGLAGPPGAADGIGSAAQFGGPSGIWGDGAGNLFVADGEANTIRKINIATRAVSTIAGTPGMTGSTDGVGSAALFSRPAGIWGDGVNLYIADSGNNTIRKLNLATGAVSTFAGTAGISINFNEPLGIWGDGYALYVTDQNTIRRVDLATGAVIVLSGQPGNQGNVDGSNRTERFNGPTGIWGDGTRLYITEFENGDIRIVTPSTPTAPAPALSFADPSFLVQGATTANLRLIGSNLARPTLSIGGTAGATLATPPPTTINPNVLNENLLTVTLNLTGASGTVTFTVTTPGGTSNTLTLQVIPSFNVTHLAGSDGGEGSADGAGLAARFDRPDGVWSDGTNVYVADRLNHEIRKVVIATGAVTTLAGQAGSPGNSDGTGSAARFNNPTGIWGDGSGNLYIADANNQTIRKLVIATGAVTTFAGQAGFSGFKDAVGTSAQFSNPVGLWGDGTNLYVSDSFNNRIRKITIATASVTTLAGGIPGAFDAIGTTAQFLNPRGITGDNTGNLFVADNGAIRQVAIGSTSVTTLVGLAGAGGTVDGVGSAARFNFPQGVWADGLGDVYVTEANGEVIRKVVVSGATVTTLAGSAGIAAWLDGTGSTARFNFPIGITGAGGKLYIGDESNSTIRQIDIATASVTTLAGQGISSGSSDGIGNAARFALPRSIWGDGTNLFVSDTNNQTIRKIVIATGATSTLAGLAGAPGSTNGVGSAARFNFPRGIWGDAANLYVADRSNHTIRKIVVASGAVTTVAGQAISTGSVDGTGTAARFNQPNSLWGDGTYLYITDENNSIIRRMELATGIVTTIAGQPGIFASADGVGSSARFNRPGGIWGDGTNLYIADQANDTIRQLVLSTGVVTTIAGIPGVPGDTDGVGSQVRLNNPQSLWGDGTYLYFVQGNVVRRIVLATGQVNTIAGQPGAGSLDGNSTAARFFNVTGIWGDGANLYVVDNANHAIRKLAPLTATTPSAPTLTGISPANGLTSSSVPVVLTGTGFVVGQTAVNVPAGITVSGVTVTSLTSLAATFTISPTAATGPYNVTVTTPAGTTSALPFNVGAAPPPPIPTLTSINPAAGLPGTNVPVTLSGTNFIAGATALVISGSGVTGTAVSVTSGTGLTATLVISPTAPLGNYSVAVTTAGGTSGSLTFTVAFVAPIYFNDFETPATAFNGLTTSGALSSLSLTSLPSDNGGISSPNQSTWLGRLGSNVNKTPGTSELVTLSLNGLVPGVRYAVAFDLLIGSSWDGSAGGFGPDEWKLSATSGVNTTTLVDATFSNCGLSNELCGAFSPQSYSDASPLAGPNGSFSAETGADFFSDTNSDYSQDYGIYYFGHGAGNPLLSFTATTSTATLTFGRPIQSSDSSDEYWALDNILVAGISAPVLSSISPASGGQGVSVPVTLTGSGFVPGATVLTVSGTGVTLSSLNVVSSTSLTATFVIAPTAATGARNVVVTTAGGTSVTMPFTVTSTAPTLTSIVPNSGGQGTTVPVTLTGTNFAVGATAVTVGGTGVTVTSVVVSGPTSLTASFIIDPNAATGARGVTVSTAIGTSTTVPFNVTSTAPTLASIAPNSGGQGTTVPVTLTGTNFAVGATAVTVGGTGVTVTSVVVSNSTSLTASFVIDPNAPTGGRGVTVSTAIGTSGSQTFTVLAPPAPTLSGINVNSGTQGATVPVILTGSGFVAGGTVLASSGSGIIVEAVNVTSSSSLTALLLLNGTAGLRGLTVSTAFGTSGSLGFTINPSPLQIASAYLSAHLAGSTGGRGYIDGTGAAARFNFPLGIWTDGTNAYVTDNGTIRKIVLATGATTTLAGSFRQFNFADGVGTTARFANPNGIWGDGTNLYVADTYNSVIRQIEIATGKVTTLAGSPGLFDWQDGTGGGAHFTYPAGIWGDGLGNLYVADGPSDTIRKITISTGAVVTVAGSPFNSGSSGGFATDGATFNLPQGVWGDGANLYIADSNNNIIRRLEFATNQVTTLAGTANINGNSDGTGTGAQFYTPSGIWGDGTSLYIADTNNRLIRKIDIASAAVTTFAGGGNGDGTGTSAGFSDPTGISSDGANLYVVDSVDSTIRKISIASAAVTTISGQRQILGTSDGTGSAAGFLFPAGVWGDGTNLYEADSTTNVIRKVVIATGTVSTFAGTKGIRGSADGIGAAASFADPMGIWGDGANLYVTDSGNNTIRKIVIATGAVTTIAGDPLNSGAADGIGSAALFNVPVGIWGDGSNLYIADANNATIRRIVLATRAVTTIAGTPRCSDCAGFPADGNGPEAEFASPQGIWGDGVNLYIADSGANAIRQLVLATNDVTTLAGTLNTEGVNEQDGVGSAAGFVFPVGLTGDGSYLYVTDNSGQTIRKIEIATATVTTIAGFPRFPGGQDGIGPMALFSDPTGIWSDGSRLYIMEDAAIRTLTPITLVQPSLSTLIPSSGSAGTDVAVTLKGFEFDPKTTTITVVGGGVTASPAVLTAGGTLLTTLTIDPAAAAGARAITVSTSAGTSNALTFTVNPGTPTLTGINPGSGSQGASVPVTLAGSNFIPGATALTASGTGITVTSVVVTSGTVMTATFVIDPAAATGNRSVTVNTASGTSGAVVFTVTPPAAPTLSLVNPGSGTQGATIPVTLTGSGFIPGATTVTASTTAILVSSVNVVSSTSLTATFVLNGAPATVAINVVTAAGTSGSQPFTINANLLSSTTAFAVTHLAGTGGFGNVDGTAAGARFNQPQFAWSDGANLYVSDRFNHTIRKVVQATGVVTTVAGTPGTLGYADGAGAAALFFNPEGVWGDGTNLYVADQGNRVVRKIALATGVVTTLAGAQGQFGSTDGSCSAARFGTNLQGLWGDASNLYVVDSASNTIRQIALASCTVSTMAGLAGLSGTTDLPGAAARFSSPMGVWGDGTNLYVTDFGNNTIRQVQIALPNNVSTLVTSGGADPFQGPYGIWSDGTNLYVADFNNNRIRKVVISTGAVTNLAGAASGYADATGTAAQFFEPVGMAGNALSIFVVDTGNNVIRTLAFGTPVVGTLAGLAAAGGYVDGSASVARLNNPQGMWGDGTNLYVVDQTYDVVRKIVLATGVVSTLAGNGNFGAVDGPPAVARFEGPQGVWGDGTNLYVADRDNFTIRTVNLATGTVSTLAGSAGQTGSTDATGSAARFNNPQAIWGDGKNLYVTDFGSALRKIVIATGAVTTLAGTNGAFGTNDGTGATARFNGAEGIWGDGTNLYVTDFSSNSIRKVVIATGVVTTFAGSAGTSGSTDAVGTNARFNTPIGIWGDGANLYVADTSNQTIRKINLATASVSTVAGTALKQGTDDAIGTMARFMNPNYVWGDGTNVYVTDSFAVRALTNFGSPVLASLTPTSVSQGTTVSATLFGSNFTPNTTVSVSGGGITVSPVTVTGSGTLLANFIISPSAATGTRSVTVSTAAGTSNVQTLTVNAATPAPTLSSIIPSTAAQGDTKLVALAGTNFVIGATTLTVSGTGITISAPVVSSASAMTATFLIDPAATTGPRSVTLTTPGGTSSITFTVTVPAPLAPAITALDIAAGVQGATIPVTVTGTNFVTGATSLVASGTGLVVSSVSAISTTSLSAVLQLSGAVGPYGLAAVTSAGSSSPLTFTINPNVIASASQLDVSHFLGSVGGIGMVDGTTGAAARFNHPLALWSSGSNLYVADTVNSAIRQTSLSTGATTVFAGLPGTAGSSDGIGLAARFNSPDGVWGDGIALYVADSGSSTIRRVLLSSGLVQTLAGTPGISGKNDGTGAAAQFSTPIGLWADSSSTFMYVADNGNNNIRRITIATGAVVTVAGSTSGLFGSIDAVGTAARFAGPVGIWGDGTNLYVADSGNNTIRKIVIATGAVTTVAGATDGSFGSGDGVGTAATFGTPWSMWGDGPNLYVGEIGNNTIRKIVISSMTVSTIAGSGGTVGWVDATGTAALFNSPNGLGGDPANIYVAEGANSAIRKIDFGTNVVTTLAGQPVVTGATNAAGAAALFQTVTGVTGDGTNLYIADAANNEIRKAVIASRIVSTFAGAPGLAGLTDGIGGAARFLSLNAMTSDGANLYVADLHSIRKVVIATGAVTTLAGTANVPGAADGLASAATFNTPQGVWSDGTNVYVSDSQNNTIRKVVIATGAVTTIAGLPGQSTFFADGTGTAARFFLPAAIWGDGTNLYIADSGNNRIRKMNLSTLAVTTLAGSDISGIADGTGAAAQFAGVFGIWGDGSNLYVTEVGQNLVRKVGIATGTVTTIAGRSAVGFAGADDGRGPVAQFNQPFAVWGDGNALYVSDPGNASIRKLTLSLPAPVLTAALPNTVLDLPSGSTVTVGLTGDNFAPGATTVSVTGSGGVTIGTVNVISRTTLTVNLTINIVNGNYNVSVTTPSGTSNSVPFAFLNP